MKRTKIVATLGPATNTYKRLKQLGNAGVNIFRLNFSHGAQSDHKKIIDLIKKLNADTGQYYSIMIDTKGPEIRTGEVSSPIELKRNQILTLTVDDVPYETSRKIKINYEAFIKDVKVGQKILVDNGVMNLKVLEITKRDVICRVLDGGMLGSRRHVNLSGQDISLESITEKDWEDIAFAVDQKVDFLALSFIRSAEDILKIREYLTSRKSDIELITKVETLRATKNIDELFKVSDGIMVARGDLGAEIPFEKVPTVQLEIAQKGARYKKPVIVATHMLESMIKDPIPTRAETTDVFTAIWQQNDAIMLSAETSVGAYPIKAVETMTKIARETEKMYPVESNNLRKVLVTNEREAFCKNATDIVRELKSVSFIIVITKTGATAKILSSFRPSNPIFAFTENASVCRNMSLLWGTKGFLTKLESDPEKTIQNAIKILLKTYPRFRGKKYVLLSNILIDNKMTEALQIRTIE